MVAGSVRCRQSGILFGDRSGQACGQAGGQVAKRTILGIREMPAVGASPLSLERTTPVDDVIVLFGASDGQGTSTVAATAALQAAQHGVDPL